MTSNFQFLARHQETLAQLGERAEANFTEDPNTCIVKLRQFSETFVKHIARLDRAPRTLEESISGWTRRLVRRGSLDDFARTLILEIWRQGSDAVHDLVGDHKLAAKLLRNCRQLAIWYEAHHGNPNFKPPKFQLPKGPQGASAPLAEALAAQETLAQALEDNEAELEAYRTQLQHHLQRLEKPQVVLQRSLADALGNLDEALRVKVREQIVAFKANPDLFDLATFGTAADDNLRWVILDEGHDVVLIAARSPHGDLLVCPWVGPFEAAARRVKSLRVEVNPDLGMLQVYDTTPVQDGSPATGAFLPKVTDEELALCGVPRPLIPAVRALPDVQSFESLQAYLPEEASTALLALVGGASVIEAREAAGLHEPRVEVDTSDFGAALSHGVSKRSFVRGDDDDAFRQVLEAPLEQWRVFLHPIQQRVVRIRSNGPVRVLGGAGTGKTVALLHRVKHLLDEELGEDARVLVTTYTRNLARDVQVQLAKLLPPEQQMRVEVSHLHQFAASIVRRADGPFKVVDSRQRKALWERAHSIADPMAQFELQFVMEEWERVVQAQGITSKREYWKARRQGRGTQLARGPRTKIWSIFSTYRSLLDDERVQEWSDVTRRALDVVGDSSAWTHQAVLVDEVQDLSQVELKLLRALAEPGRNDLFMVGDAHQRIYALGSSLSSCGIQIRGRSFRLKINYRTTDAIRRLAVGVLAGSDFDDLDGGADSLAGYKSLREGEAPTVQLFATMEEEQAHMVGVVQEWLRQIEPEGICIAARTGWLLNRYVAALKKAGIATVPVSRDSSEDMGPGIRVATMHRLKGTEFKRVLLCGLQTGTMPLTKAMKGHGDDAAREDALKQERCLLYVAATRARDALAIMGNGTRSPLLDGWEDAVEGE